MPMGRRQEQSSSEPECWQAPSEVDQCADVAKQVLAARLLERKSAGEPFQIDRKLGSS